MTIVSLSGILLPYGGALVAPPPTPHDVDYFADPDVASILVGVIDLGLDEVDPDLAALIVDVADLGEDEADPDLAALIVDAADLGLDEVDPDLAGLIIV